ncbi:hypothetical protein Rhal01_03159 [Rubritalea halochordaticola]|uniref:SLA1 homology domain-containing protein n=1 Tax=Rubritalea halochordaticola TaxID=714537 RepID=A0ABP9V7B8_9BACT
MKYLPYFAAISFLFPCQYACARTWTDTKGRKLEAELVNKSGNEVTLKRESDGKEFTVKVEIFSAEDREFVTEWEPKSLEEKEDVTPAPKRVNGRKALDDVSEKHFSGEWPRLISADVSMEIEEDRGNENEYIYRSENYEFISNAKLSAVPVKRFAMLFEATKSYVQALPLGNSKAHRDTGDRYKVYLFETKSQYVRAGGPAQSAGVFMPSKGVIMVPFESLGLVGGAGSYRMDYERTNKTLPHEITHQITNAVYYAPGARGWYTEGLAEYVAVTPYRSGKFSCNNVERAVEEFVTGYSRKDNRGRALGEEINAPDLEKYMNMSYGEFTANGNFNYGLAALIVTYFCHYDGEGDGENLKNFLRALAKGESGKEAQKKLLAGRTFDELEKDIAKQWSRHGVKINFL